MRSEQFTGGEPLKSARGEGARDGGPAAVSSGPRLARGPIGERELIWMMALLMALNAFGIDAILPALDTLASDLGAVGNSRQFIVGAYLLAAGFGTLVPGSLADRFGRKPVLLTSIAFYIAFSLLCAVVTDFTMMVVTRALQGFFAAGIIALPPAIIRDKVGGDKMARMMSLIFVIFLLVPAVAPSIGQGILHVMGDWRWIFAGMALAGVTMSLWVWLRLAETLHPEDRQEIRLKPIVRNMVSAVTLRRTIGYTLGSALIFGGLFGFINSSQQLIGEAFGAGDAFPMIFAICAGSMAVANWTNSRLVERFGARRISHGALLLFVAVAGAQLYFALRPDETLWTFVPLMAANMSLLGFVGANFGSIAMQPFAHIAGAASSAQSFLRMTTGAALGASIGYAYDGTARPLATALLVTALLSLALVFFSEKGKLFGAPEPDDD